MTAHTFTPADRKAIRALVMGRANVSRVRITVSGRVDAYGIMPNSSKVGWWFAGYDTDLLREALNQD